MSISADNIGRSISALGFRIHGEMEAKRAEGAASKLAETDQQFQVDVSGEAAQLVEWTTIDVTFDETIYRAPAQRQNPLEEPHFTFGSTMQSETPVMLHATVQGWTLDSAGNFIGATVAIGAAAPAVSPTQFSARVHLTFQGYSSPNYPATGTGEG